MPKQPFIALIEKGNIEDCFIITKTGMCFAAGGNDDYGIDSVSIQNAYYVGDIYFMEQMSPDLLPLPFGITQFLRNVNSCYYRIEDLYDLSVKYSGSIDMYFVNQIKSALYGECVTDGHLRNINTFSGWDIAKKVERTNELWGIDDGNGIPGEIPETNDILVVTFSKTYDDRYANLDCFIITESNYYSPIRMETKINDDNYEDFYFYFSADVFEGKSQNDITIVGTAATNSLEPEGWEYWMNYCSTTYPDQNQGGALMELAMGAETFRTISINEVPIMISMPPLSGPYCNYAE